MIDREIARRIKAIEQDKLHGARWLSQQALSTLLLATEKSRVQSTDRFLEELRQTAQVLIQARPSMASIASYLSQFVYAVITYSQQDKDLNSLKTFARTEGNNITESSRQALLKVAELGAEIVQPSDILITCSYSSTVCEALKIARQQSKNFQVIITESRSPNGRLYGKITAEQLKQLNIIVKLIPDADLQQNAFKATKALVGADSILAHGSLINGTPTYALALAAKDANIPFYSLCETAKFDIRSYQGRTPELEPGFDQIPPQLITGLITELGIIKPTEVFGHIDQRKKYWQAVYG